MDEKVQQLKLQRLYDRVLTDSDFRTLLASNPEEALRKIDIEPTEEILRVLKSIADEVARLEHIFGGRRGFAI
jgi:hypothetical protein